MAFTDFLFNGQTPPAVTSETNTGGSLPLWYSSYLSTLANQAANIASTPYQNYGGPRIADINPQEQQAYDYLGANASNWQSPLQTAQGAASGVAGGFDSNEFSKYMSPYTSGVTDEIQRLGLRNMNENLIPALQSQFIGAGQANGPMSTRGMDMGERLVRDVGADISGKQAQALEQGFQTSMGAYNTGQANTNAAAQNLGGLSQLQQALTTGTAGALSASGQTMRGYDQSNMDLAYQDFLNQQNYPRQNVNFLSSVLRGTQVPTGQDTTSTQPFNGTMSASPLATFAGLTMAGLGGMRAQPSSVPGARTGGYVAHLARGGRVSPLSLASSMPTRRMPVTRHMRMAAPRSPLELMAA